MKFCSCLFSFPLLNFSTSHLNHFKILWASPLSPLLNNPVNKKLNLLLQKNYISKWSPVFQESFPQLWNQYLPIWGGFLSPNLGQGLPKALGLCSWRNATALVPSEYFLKMMEESCIIHQSCFLNSWAASLPTSYFLSIFTPWLKPGTCSEIGRQGFSPKRVSLAFQNVNRALTQAPSRLKMWPPGRKSLCWVSQARIKMQSRLCAAQQPCCKHCKPDISMRNVCANSQGTLQDTPEHCSWSHPISYPGINCARSLLC